MRALTVTEMNQASGGIPVVPIVGVAVALGGLAVKHKVAATVIGVASLLLAGHSLIESNNNSCSVE